MKRAVAPIVALLLCAATALAEEGHHGSSHHEAAGIPWATLFFSAVNFSIFVAILYRYAWPPVRTWLSDRHAQVVADLEAAALAKADAERLRAEWEQRMAQLDSEAAEMRIQARADIARERERILAAAQKTAEAIRRDAERAAVAEVRRTQEALRAEMVHAAVRRAADLTRQGWTAEDQKRSLADFLKQVQG